MGCQRLKFNWAINKQNPPLYSSQTKHQNFTWSIVLAFLSEEKGPHRYVIHCAYYNEFWLQEKLVFILTLKDLSFPFERQVPVLNYIVITNTTIIYYFNIWLEFITVMALALPFPFTHSSVEKAFSKINQRHFHKGHKVCHSQDKLWKKTVQISRIKTSFSGYSLFQCELSRRTYLLLVKSNIYEKFLCHLKTIDTKESETWIILLLEKESWEGRKKHAIPWKNITLLFLSTVVFSVTLLKSRCFCVAKAPQQKGLKSIWRK